MKEGARPDLVCLGKGLGGGFPISACIGSASVMAAWATRGGGAIHTATHFASPVACAAALATLAELRKRRLPLRARGVGERWIRRLAGRVLGLGVRTVRGRGLMIGVHLEGGGGRTLAIARRLLSRGYIVLTGGLDGDVLTLTPALDIPETLLAAFGEELEEALKVIAA
jgi:4-aminobutyrate aminotransferase/(S)-3-amino-2-methylpropionate transaminase